MASMYGVDREYVLRTVMHKGFACNRILLRTTSYILFSLVRDNLCVAVPGMKRGFMRPWKSDRNQILRPWQMNFINSKRSWLEGVHASPTLRYYLCEAR